jgi:hypothetical protein
MPISRDCFAAATAVFWLIHRPGIKNPIIKILKDD